MNGSILFCYGTLGPAFDPARDWRPDAMRGRLYDLGAYPALIDLDNPGAAWIEGHVRPTDNGELRDCLDPYEGVDDGLFQRVLSTTRAGRRAWVYVYSRPLPQWARGPLPSWPDRSAELPGP